MGECAAELFAELGHLDIVVNVDDAQGLRVREVGDVLLKSEGESQTEEHIIAPQARDITHTVVYAVAGPQHEAQICHDRRKMARMNVVRRIVQDTWHCLYGVAIGVRMFNFQ